MAMSQQRLLIDKTIVARKPLWRANLNDSAQNQGPPSAHCSFRTWECRIGERNLVRHDSQSPSRAARGFDVPLARPIESA